MSGLEIKVVDQVVRVSEGMGPPGPPGPGNQIVESGGPTALAVGAIADGQLLRRQGNAIVGESPSVGGTSDHGQLQGLADDDHPQYHTDARGDARYSQLGHNHDGAYEAAGTASTALASHVAAAGAHPISGVDGLVAALALLAPLLSPALTGTPTAPTASPGTNSTQIATTGFVAAAIAALLNSAPGALDTLDELAAALGDDPNFATTITNALAGKLAKASNLSDLTDAAAARTNLGAGAVGASIFVAATASAIRALLELGGAALLNVGTTSGTVAAGDDGRFSDARTPTAHTHPLSQIEGSGASAGQVPTWTGTGWLPSTPSGASPAGSGTELQVRNGTSLGAASGTAWDAVNNRMSIGAGAAPAGKVHVQSGAASEVGLVVQGATSQTAALQEWRNSAGTVLASLLAAQRLAFGSSYFGIGPDANHLDIAPAGSVVLRVITNRIELSQPLLFGGTPSTRRNAVGIGTRNAVPAIGTQPGGGGRDALFVSADGLANNTAANREADGFTFVTGAGGAPVSGDANGGDGGNFNVALGAGGAKSGTGNDGAPGAFIVKTRANVVRFAVDEMGRIFAPSIPTSSAGLPAGAVWSDGGTLKIV
jgi:hypothetical protein